VARGELTPAVRWLLFGAEDEVQELAERCDDVQLRVEQPLHLQAVEYGEEQRGHAVRVDAGAERAVSQAVGQAGAQTAVPVDEVAVREMVRLTGAAEVGLRQDLGPGPVPGRSTGAVAAWSVWLAWDFGGA
jgi:hypothetical protein